VLELCTIPVLLLDDQSLPSHAHTVTVLYEVTEYVIPALTCNLSQSATIIVFLAPITTSYIQICYSLIPIMHTATLCMQFELQHSTHQYLLFTILYSSDSSALLICSIGVNNCHPNYDYLTVCLE